MGHEGFREAYLPVLYPSSHAANLYSLRNGDLLCVWFSGTWEGNSNVGIVISQLRAGTDRWSATRLIDQREGASFQNPLLFQSPDGVLHLYHTSQPAKGPESAATVWQLMSSDNGKTWSTPQLLFAKPGSYTRHPPVILPDGTWLLPLSYITSAGIGRGAMTNYPAMELSRDNGKSWRECLIPHADGLIQPTTIAISPHRFITFFRDRASRWIYKSTSSDGCAWTRPEPTPLPNNNASVQAYRLRDGHIVMVFNNSQADPTHKNLMAGLRKPLSIALSTDGAKTWSFVRDIETGRPGYGAAEAKPKRPGREEYSYPTVVQTRDGRIHVAFTFRRETIKEVSFPESWIRKESTAGFYRPAAP